MSDLAVLAADGTTVAVLRALFARERWDLALGCGRFGIEPERDIFHDALHRDGGVYRNAQELLRPLLGSYRYAMVILDSQFGSERPADEIRVEVGARLDQNGWRGRSNVVVIDPELESWLWQDSPHVEDALGVPQRSLRQQLLRSGQWPEGATKPLQPKETFAQLIKNPLKPKVVYSRIARSVSTRGCTDPAFAHFCGALRSWFPLEP
ncbi:MAG: hypothetical protein AMXMBFR36_08950 [Acidobacteriota bacterium]